VGVDLVPEPDDPVLEVEAGRGDSVDRDDPVASLELAGGVIVLV
jgi:hypothetical protein